MTFLSPAQKALREAGVENALQEGRWMEELLPRESARRGLSPDALREEWLKRRIGGEPFQYVVGSVEFHQVELQVGPGTLIPRPETELLVDRALEVLRGVPAGETVLDLCTGSGAIPLALARLRPDLRFLGVDLSPDALAWARRNAALLQSQDICQFLQGDLFAPLPPRLRFPLVTANPPYISPEEYRRLPPEILDYEPRIALEAQENGLALEREIILQARHWLKPGGVLLLEMGETQGDALRETLLAHGYEQVRILPDLTGRDRFAEGVSPAAT
ncbi:MAG: peptide chain release factor N(5)-glutamine methyltransferase [Oligosphaeraceae bacterium]